MGSILGKKPKVDNAAMAAQQKALEQQRKENERIASEAKAREEKENAAKEDLRKRQRMGRRSLLGESGDELGVM
jgi:hypothetical protein